MSCVYLHWQVGSLPLTSPGKSPFRTYMHFISESPRSFPKRGCHIPSLVEFLILPLISTIQPQLRTDRMKITQKAVAPHSSTLAWKIPWTEEPGRLQSMGLLRVRHDFHFSLSCIGEGNGNPLQCSCLENPRDGGAWWAAVYGVSQSRT